MRKSTGGLDGQATSAFGWMVFTQNFMGCLVSPYFLNKKTCDPDLSVISSFRVASLLCTSIFSNERLKEIIIWLSRYIFFEQFLTFLSSPLESTYSWFVKKYFQPLTLLQRILKHF